MIDRGQIAYAGMRVAAGVVPRLPETVVAPLGELAGAVGYALARPARRAIATNLSAVLDPGDPDLVALRAREAFRTQAANYVDLFRTPHLAPEQIERAVEVRGVENIERARSLGRGLIFASVHLGNLDLIAQIATPLGIPVTIPVEPIRPRALLDLVIGMRASHGLRIVPVDRTIVATLVRALRHGEAVAFAIDRDVQGSARPMRFFGRPARLSPAPAALALRCGAPILPVHCQRLGWSRLRATVDAPLLPPDSRGPGAVDDLMARLIHRLETFVRQTPGQWVMFHSLFERPEQP